jgi:hypothetical protein
VDADPADVVFENLDLAGVDRGADLDPEVTPHFNQTERASERPGGRVERREDAVARRLDESTMEALDLRLCPMVVTI